MDRVTQEDLVTLGALGSSLPQAPFGRLTPQLSSPEP